MPYSLAKLRKLITGAATALRRRARDLSNHRSFQYLAVIGPGIIAANAGNDASGIATYSSVGAEYGYSLMWVFIPMTISLIVVQEMCIRMGTVTGKGLADLVREQFGVRWTALIMLALLIANSGVIVSEFVGIAQASELFGVSRYITIPFFALFIWFLVVRGTQKRVERVFLAMSLVFIGYFISAFLVGPDWMAVGRGLVNPAIPHGTNALFTVMAMIGTTITPFMQVYVQSSVVDKGLDVEDLPLSRVDAVVGTTFANIVAAFIVICTAATLYASGTFHLDSATTAAQALTPVAGQYATYLFAIGLLGAAMLAMGVLPLATAYSLSEALGFEKGVSQTFRDAPIFLSIFTSLIVVGAVFALIPGIPQIKLLILTQSINGVLLPVLLIVITKLSGNKLVMGNYANRGFIKIVAWATTIAVSILSLLLIGKTVADIF